MANVKTAISLPDSLLAAADTLARETHMSRSRLIAPALAEYLGRHKSQQLFDQLNAIYDAPPDPADQQVLDGYHRIHRRLLEDQR